MLKKVLCSMVLMGFMAFLVNGWDSCRWPLPWNKAHCLDIEKTILDATVRIAFHGTVEIEDGYEMIEIKGTISHATIIDGRYLLTHNHFGIPLSQVQLYAQYAQHGFQGVSVYRLDGVPVIDHAGLDIFTVVNEKGETVLLDFGTVAGQGFFTHAGFSSVQSNAIDNLVWSPGTEVALIDWDGKDQTRVVWAKIQSVYQDQELQLIKVDHFVEIGASGGGIFLNTQHIGNIWQRTSMIDKNTGSVGQQFTIGALNSQF